MQRDIVLLSSKGEMKSSEAQEYIEERAEEREEGVGDEM